MFLLSAGSQVEFSPLKDHVSLNEEEIFKLFLDHVVLLLIGRWDTKRLNNIISLTAHWVNEGFNLAFSFFLLKTRNHSEPLKSLDPFRPIFWIEKELFRCLYLRQSQFLIHSAIRIRFGKEVGGTSKPSTDRSFTILLHCYPLLISHTWHHVELLICFNSISKLL